MASIGVLGAGTWGIALARLFSKCGHTITVWARNPDDIRDLSVIRRQKNLPDMVIPDEIMFTSNIADACTNTEFLFFAVPSVAVRSVTRSAAPFIQLGQIIVDVAKGIEPNTLYTMTQVIRDELHYSSIKIVALSGPTHAEEVAKDLPSTIVSACIDIDAAVAVQELFVNSCVRVYTSPDVEGVELCGATKNIIALAAGIAVGLGYGDNTKDALITRGMAEITRLGKALGCYTETFSGLAGIGDLIVTATSQHSRNNRCGELIGRGMSPVDAVKKVGMVVEGINAIPAVRQFASRYNLSLPITEAVDAIINKGRDPKNVVADLMGREQREEIGSSIVYEHALLQKEMGLCMKRIITYGTFDLLHYGHINLLRRAKALGDYLIVAISTDEFNWNEKKKKCYFTYEQRKSLVEAVRYVDLVIPEESWDQKRRDIHEYHIDTFVIGDDWKGKFDFLKEEGAEVVYLPRTPEISSTQIKKDLYDANAIESESKTSHDDIKTD